MWLVADRLLARDSVIFAYQSLVETSRNLLGALAGLDRLYFSSFQFKRQHQFTARMPHAPARIADHLDELFVLDLVAAGIALESLVDETLMLVETQMPEIDTAAPRRHIEMRGL